MDKVSFSLQLTGADGAALDRAMIAALEARGYRVFQARTHGVSLAQIKRHIAERFGLPEDALTGERRTAVLAQARQLAMYLARELTSCSLVSISEGFGRRDPSTARWAIAAIRRRMAADQALRDSISILRHELTELEAPARK